MYQFNDEPSRRQTASTKARKYGGGPRYGDEDEDSDDVGAKKKSHRPIGQIMSLLFMGPLRPSERSRKATRQSSGRPPRARAAPLVRGSSFHPLPNPARTVAQPANTITRQPVLPITATAAPTITRQPVLPTTATAASTTPRPADGLPSAIGGTALASPRNEVDIVIHNLHADARGTSRAMRTQPMAVLLAHIMGIIAREGLLLHSVAATVHSITIVLEDGTLGKRKGGFRGFVGELVNMAGADGGGGIEHNEHVMAH